MDALKKSACGEVREFWEAAVRLWKESGIAVRDFCRREGLAESTFHAWRRRFRTKDASSDRTNEPSIMPSAKPSSEPSAMPEKVPPPQGRRRQTLQRSSVSENPKPSAVEFLPVRVISDELLQGSAVSRSASLATASIEVVHVSGWHVRIPAGFDPTTLDTVLSILERRRC